MNFFVVNTQEEADKVFEKASKENWSACEVRIIPKNEKDHQGYFGKEGDGAKDKGKGDKTCG